jgi:hypothetical protein
MVSRSRTPANGCPGWTLAVYRLGGVQSPINTYENRLSRQIA